MGPLHPLALQLADVAEEYERGRPDYDPGAVGALAAELGLAPGARVLDLAAGTGKLSRALLAAGYDVVAVEPQVSLRKILCERIGPERVCDGLAEEIPLPDASVEAVTVADGFHWFDRPRALEEIRRVLRPGQGLAVVTTVPDWGGASWYEGFVRLVTDNRGHHPNFDGPPWHEFVRDAPGWGEPWEVHVTSFPPADPSRFPDHFASMSFIAALPQERRADLTAEVREMLATGDTPQRIRLTVEIGLARRADGPEPGGGGLPPAGSDAVI
jgi:SAM-dependent methyltransferase